MIFAVTAKYVRNYLVMKRGYLHNEAVSLFIAQPVRYNVVEDSHKATFSGNGEAKSESEQQETWRHIRHIKKVKLKPLPARLLSPLSPAQHLPV